MSQQIINNKSLGETGLTSRTKINENFTELYQNKVWLSTGILSGGEISIGADNISVDITSGFALFVDNTDPLIPIFTKIAIGGNVPITNIATWSRTYIGYNKNGIVQQSTPFTSLQRRTIASIGAAIHTNNTTVMFVNAIATYMSDIPIQLYDVAFAIDRMNMSGNVFFANGANLKINKTQGDIFKVGVDGIENPFFKTLDPLTAPTFQYRLQNGTVTSNQDTIDPNNYDLSGVKTSVDTGKFTIQRINIFQSNAVRIQYGQKQYDTIEDAKFGITNDEFISESNIAENGFLRAHLIVKQGTTDLTDALKALFVEVNKYGMVAGSVGAALTASNIASALGYTPASETNIEDIYNSTFEPTGFPVNSIGQTERSTSEFVFDPLTRKLTIQPTGDSFFYYLHGIKYVVTNPLELTFDDVEGRLWFYIDADDNTFKYSRSLAPPAQFILKHVAIAQGYWDATNKELVLGVGDERHTCVQDGQSHLQVHTTIGTRLSSGGGLIDFTIGDGSDNSHCQFNIEQTVIYDEDLIFTIPVTNFEIKCLYQESPIVWRKSINTGFAFLTAGSGRIAYQNNYSLSESTSGKYVLYHYYATSGDSPTGQFFAVAGMTQYDTIEDAVLGASYETKMLSRDTLVINEEKLLGTIVFESGSYSGGAKIVQVSTITGLQNYIDWRNTILGYDAENTTNKVTSWSTVLSDEKYPSEKLVKDYIDNLALGLKWQEPVELINLTGSTTTYIAPVDFDAYILDTGAAADFASNGSAGFSDGDIVQSQGGVYVKIKTLAVNDRFVIEAIGNTTPVGIGLNKKNYIAVCTNATPSSLAFTYTAAENNMATYVQNANAAFNNVSYTYTTDLTQWVQLSASPSLTYENGLKVVGNILQLGNLVKEWVQQNDYNINHAGTFNGLRLIAQATGFTIAGGTVSKTLTVPNTASVSGTNTGDQDLSGLVPKTTTVNSKALSGNITLDKSDVGLGNVTNDVQLKTASNLSDLNNAATARTNLGLGTLATQSGTFSGSSSGTNTGDETAARIASINHNASSKVSIVDADEITGQDSENSFSLIRTTWASVKAFLKTYFDTIYTLANLGGLLALFTGYTTKSAIVDNDIFILNDSEATNAVKKTTWSNIKSVLKTYFDTLYQVVLVSGTNIKTIKGISVLGSGNIAFADYQALPADPTITNSTVGVMMGLAGAITPIATGRIMIIISGDVDNATNARGSQFQIRTGTGTAPANGAALTGTTQGSLMKFFNNNANERNPFTLNAIVTGLTLNTAIWVDISLASITGGNSRVRDLNISIIEF